MTKTGPNKKKAKQRTLWMSRDSEGTSGVFFWADKPLGNVGEFLAPNDGKELDHNVNPLRRICSFL